MAETLQAFIAVDPTSKPALHSKIPHRTIYDSNSTSSTILNLTQNHNHLSSLSNPFQKPKMSFLFNSRPQLSSAEKIAAAETEVEMVSDMFNRSVQSPPLPPSPSSSPSARLHPRP